MADYIRGKKAYTKWDVEAENVDMDIPPEGQQLHIQTSDGWFSGKKGKVLKALFLVSLFFIGLLVGYLIRRSVHEAVKKKSTSSPITYNDLSDYINYLQENVDSQNIRNNLREVTEVHRAGSDAGNEFAKQIKDKWKNYGLKSAHLEKYDVLLSVPSADTPNKINLLDKDGNSISEIGSVALPPEMQSYLAYSPNGTAQGKLVYAHYGREEDFEYLTKLNISINGSIVIMRNGKVHRGNKVKLAEKYGALAVLLYPDPTDYIGENMKIYPDGLGLPGDDIIRGSLKLYPGDPQTPFFPSTSGTYRIPVDQVDLPKIPVQPLSYDDAQEIMKDLGGPQAPEDWKGKLNISYNLGPEFDSEKSNISEVKVMVYNQLQQKEIHNVIATIQGKSEPDRYIIIGGHHDSWTNGSADPGTGVAVLMELARLFRFLQENNGWIPDRTIVLASWDAEEFGITGSTEWVEAHSKELSHRAVAYINIDAAVTGNYTLQVLGSPLLRHALKEASKKVPCHEKDHPELTVYDTWSKRRPQNENSVIKEPLIEIPGSGSDFVSFIYGHGISSVHLQFVSKDAVSDYPLYHTSYDTFDAVMNYTDPDLTVMETMTKLLGTLVIILSDSFQLPMLTQDYSDRLKQDFDNFNKTYKKLLLDHQISIDAIESAISSFGKTCQDFHNNFDTVGKNARLLSMHEYNDRFLELERSFLLPYGVPSLMYTRSVLYGPDFQNNYMGVIFPHLYKAIYEAKEEDTVEKWNSVHLQVSYIYNTVQSAIGVLRSHILTGQDDL